VLTTRLLLVHRTVVAEGTLTAAAAVLGYTVSAVSQQLSQLEAESASTLFEKAGRGVRPTAAGLLLAEHATRILAAVEEAESELADLRAGLTGRLRVVSFYTAGESLLPPAIVALRSSMPGLHVLPLVDETGGALHRLRAGEAELALVVESFGRGEEPDDDLVRVHLLDDEYRVLLHHDHPLARRRVVDLVELADTDWVVAAGWSGGVVGQWNYVREATETACRRAGFTPRIVAEADEFAVTQSFVAAGIGVALAPVLALGVVRDQVVVRRIRKPPPPRHIWLVTRPGVADQAAVGQMTAALLAAARPLQSAGRTPAGPVRPAGRKVSPPTPSTPSRPPRRSPPSSRTHGPG
jgi:DNA-binding transcriptional LysR family regulator